MFLCYIDESGTPDIPGNTSHFVLAGISVPINCWREYDQQIEMIKDRYHLSGVEIHVAWILRPYLEQTKIPDFTKLDYIQRRTQVNSLRKIELLRLQRSNNSVLYKQTKKNYIKTEGYTHLTYDDRRQFIKDVAECLSKWKQARLFAECIDKIHFDPLRSTQTINEQAFEQLVSRFEQYLKNISTVSQTCFGILVHDNNQTVARKHTEMMKKFHQRGTLWTKLTNIIETPLFVDSELTSMVQIADLCGYALRRYLENGESELFDLVFKRADRKDGIAVGVRHFTKAECACSICSLHKK